MGAVFHINGVAVFCFCDNSVWLRSAHSLHGNNLFICEIALCRPPPAVIPKHHRIVSLCILNMLSVFLWTFFCEMSVKSLTIWLTVWSMDLAKDDSNPLLMMLLELLWTLNNREVVPENMRKTGKTISILRLSLSPKLSFWDLEKKLSPLEKRSPLTFSRYDTRCPSISDCWSNENYLKALNSLNLTQSRCTIDFM